MRLTSPAFFLSVALLSLALGGCDGAMMPTNTAAQPDLRVKLMPAPNGHGLIAIPPACPTWHDEQTGGPWENGLSPTYGCAEAKNLAAQVERPEDLIQGRPLGPADGVASAAAIARYEAGKTTALIDPNASAPAQIIKMEDARLGGAATK